VGEQYLFGRTGLTSDRIHINGYIEEGTTTTPFDMLVSNKCDRYTVAIQAMHLGSKANPSVAPIVAEACSFYRYTLREHTAFIHSQGTDPEVITTFDFTFKDVPHTAAELATVKRPWVSVPVKLTESSSSSSSSSTSTTTTTTASSSSSPLRKEK